MSISPVSNATLQLPGVIARARNTDVILRVVDESIERTAEARREREARRAEDRAEEDRLRRADEYERLEREDAERLTERYRAEAESIIAARAAQRDAEADAERKASFEPAPGLDVVA